MADIRYALRMLRNKPGFTIMAVLALALGIGANTAIFSVVSAVLLQPLPYRDPGRLVMVWQKLTTAAQSGPLACSAPDYVDYRDQSKTLENVAGYLKQSFNMITAEGALRIDGMRVSANAFPLLGIAAYRGRVFTAAEDRDGGEPVALLSYGAWQRRFAADPQILGRTLVLDQKPYKVIGVMARDFSFPPEGLGEGTAPEIWVPMAFTPAQLGPDARGDNFNIPAIARLKPGVTIQKATADVDRIAAGIHALYPPKLQKVFQLNAYVADLHEQVVGNVRAQLLVLLGAVGFVLLIGCANVANLLLAKAAGRRREIAVRTAIGASRARLLRQLLVESMVLGLAGGAAGLIVAAWLTQLLIRFSPGGVPRLAQSQLDLGVLAFALALSVLTGILFGLAPALQTLKGDLSIDLKEGSRGAASLRRSLLPNGLVVAEVALSLVLLAGAGLMLRSFLNLRDVQLGFRPDHLLTVSVALPATKYQSAVQVEGFYRNLMDRVRGLPDVQSVAAGTGLPFVGQWTILVTPEGQVAVDSNSLHYATFEGVTPEFHQTLGIQLKRGRFFTDADRDPDHPVAIVNQFLAQRHWPNQDPIGKRFKWGAADSSRSWISIVGVVENTKQSDPADDMKASVYLPLPAMPTGTNRANGVLGRVLAIRTTSDPSAIIANVRGVARSIDPEVPLFALKPMDALLTASIAPRRFNMLLLASLAGLALVLASIGIYGVMSYSVSQYTQEIGIRMALGASAFEVIRMIVRQGMLLVLIGLGIGAALALALTRTISKFLFGVPPTDPWTFAAVSLLLAAVAFAANYIPARRATRIDPMIALRYE